MPYNLKKKMALLTAETREECYEEMEGYLNLIGMEGLLMSLIRTADKANDGPAEILLRAVLIAYVEFMEAV